MDGIEHRASCLAMLYALSAGLLSTSGGCVEESAVDTADEMAESNVEVLNLPLGQVQSQANSHLNLAASESVVTTMGPSFEATASFNATDSTQFVTYNNNSRQVFANASQMAWTTMNSSGTILASGRLRPPSGWSVLWSDPAITRSRSNANRIYLSLLAVPTPKFNLSPTPGRIEGAFTSSIAGLCGAYVSGACIARSQDSGRTFSITDCISRITASCPNGNFYDGADIETSTDGRVYAAYRDTNNSRIDVWMTLSETGAFGVITVPPVNALSHPRIKWGPGGLYLLVKTGSTQLSLLRYQGGASRTGAWSSPVVVTNQYNDGSFTFPNGRFFRAAMPQYELDVGKDENNVDQIRIIFKVLEGGHHHLRIYKCTTGTTFTCSRVEQWETANFNANADQFFPAIAFGPRTFGGSAWVATYFDVAPGTNQGNLVRSIGAQNGIVFSFDRTVLENAQVPCPDTRGYWGDYDSMAFGAFGFFMRPFTDSSHAACVQNQFIATPQVSALHLSAVQ